MIITLDRCDSSENGTFGIMSTNGQQLCVTCEPPWNDNKDDESCIPTGTYHCVKHNGDKFQNVWEVQNVQGRTAILIHNGNTINDTHGCILVGKAIGTLNGLPAVTESVVTLNYLRSVLPDEFDLTIS